MSNLSTACVYNGIEYIITGRSAVKRVQRGNSTVKITIVELRPKFSGGFGDDLNIWVAPDELYQITEEDSDE